MSHLHPDDARQDDVHPGDESREHLLEQDQDDGDDDDDIELTELGGERTPVSHYRARDQAPKKRVSWLVIALALSLCVLGFTLNTEATAYFEDELGWKKPFATLYITHSSLALPWLVHILYLRWRDRHVPYMQWVRNYNNQLRSSIATIDAFSTSGPRLIIKRQGQAAGPLDFLATSMAIVTVVLTVSGVSWFTSLSLTTPADLTAIYNCSTFFAAAFSVPLLQERLGWVSMVAVALSILGTFTIAYGDTTADHGPADGAQSIGGSRLLGNATAVVGAVAFGLYEVVFKKWACSSRPESPESSLPLTLAASALTGLYTAAVLWVLFIPLHLLGWETLELPSAHAALWIVIAVLAGSLSITLLVLLVIWTDPVFGSMANVLSVFFVALADWLVWGLAPSLATYAGGALIFVAFGLLTWDTLAAERE